MGAKVMRNEWITLQVKCLSRRDQTDRHKDSKNCRWLCHGKTSGLCFIIVECFGTYWPLKFLYNSRHVTGSHFEKLLGVKTLCIRAKNHFEKLDTAYAAFVDEYGGSYKPSGANLLSWKNPWNFFLNGRCHWKMQKDTCDNDIEYTCILLPTIIVRDFWLSPAVHIVCEMRSKGVVDEKRLELILLGACQTSWFRFWYVGLKILEKKHSGFNHSRVMFTWQRKVSV
jgi:hypothetical protein